jgi:VCBS repeat-containing protein
VAGSVGATDADGDTLVFSAPATTVKGSVGINADTGAFTYTPTIVARQNAAAPGATPADLQDSFTVTVLDGRGGTATAAVTVAVSPAPSPSGPLAAFPGAEGFGAFATGGRDGSVVYVTNLNADGPGSLQWAIDQPGAKYVLFKVSGLIDTQIHLTNGDVTIAGQTSPGGITIRGLVTDETPYQDQTVRVPGDFAENWILQHIRIRPGASGPSDDGLRLRYTRNAIVDHVSIGNATDEAIEISYSNNITVQNTIIAETVGGHSFYGGVLMNYSNPAYGFALDNVSLHHNVFNRIEGRLPEGSRESAAAANSFMSLELSNNLYWDPRFFIALGVDTAVAGGQPIYWKLNAVNNFFRTANGFQFGMFDDQILNVGRNELFVSGNKMSLYPSRSDYQLFYCCNDYPSETSPDATSRRALARTSRHPFPEITYTPTDQLRTVLLTTAGAWPRDPMDIRLMQSVAANTISSAPIATNPANDALLAPYSGLAPAPPADSDSDGMPDAWETGNGLNPAVANHNARTLSSAGYTDLEVYLQELSASRIGSIAT